MQLNEILKEFLEKEKIFKFNLEDLKKNQFDNKFNKDLEFKIFKLKNKIREFCFADKLPKNDFFNSKT